MTPGGGPEGGGLAASLRQLVASGLELAQLRLELLGTEIEAQKLRIAAALAWGALAMVLFALALVLLVLCVMIYFWEPYRFQAAAVMLIVFLAGGVFAARLARARLQTTAGTFAASVGELRRDRDALAAAAASSNPPPREAP